MYEKDPISSIRSAGLTIFMLHILLYEQKPSDKMHANLSTDFQNIKKYDQCNWLVPTVLGFLIFWEQ